MRRGNPHSKCTYTVKSNGKIFISNRCSFCDTNGHGTHKHKHSWRWSGKELDEKTAVFKTETRWMCASRSLNATTVAKPSTDIAFHGKGANVPSQRKEEQTCIAPSFPALLFQKRRRRPSHPLARVYFRESFGKHPIGSVRLYSQFLNVALPLTLCSGKPTKQIVKVNQARSYFWYLKRTLILAPS